MKAMPCGIDYCPLFAEYRFFAEAQANLLSLDLGPDDIRRMIFTTGKVWCQQHAARNLTPDFGKCRETMKRVTKTLQEVPPKGYYGKMTAQLRKELSMRETERTESLKALGRMETA